MVVIMLKSSGRKDSGRVPCQVVAGPLGSGKTTVIQGILDRERNGRRIGVLVNDFGEIGMDETLLRYRRGRIPESLQAIPGGCLCCTTPERFEESLTTMLGEGDLDWIWIEPSGLALLHPLLRELKRLAGILPIDLQPTWGLLSPRRIRERHCQALPLFRQLVEGSDYLFGNFSDLASAGDKEEFLEWTARLKPRKRGVFLIERGMVPSDLLFRREDGKVGLEEVSSHDHHHHHAEQTQRIWQTDGSEVVPLEPLLHQLETASPEQWSSLLRVKGVLHLSTGWKEVQWSEDGCEVRDFPPQPASRMEWIFQSESRDPLAPHLSGV